MGKPLLPQQRQIGRALGLTEEELDKPIKKLIIELPPRHGKSLLASQYFPAWHEGIYPQRDLILSSATDELATDFSQAALDLLIEYGPSIFGHRVREDIRARHRWMMELGGQVRAAGVGGSIMGRGADGLIIDDFLKNMEEALSETTRDKIYKWYLSTASTRMSRRAWVVLIATRWHKKDLIGRVLEDSLNGGEKWCRLRLPAIAEANDPLGRKEGEALWPEFFPLSWLENIKRKYIASGYSWMWESLYQQNPPDVLDAEFSPEYFNDSMWFKDWPRLEGFVHRIQTCDPSLGKTDKSDFQAHIQMALDKNGVMWIEGNLQRRDRVQIAGDMLEMARWFKPEAVGIESNMWQIMLADALYEQSRAAGMSLPIWPIQNMDNKRVRIRATLTPYLARKEFRFRDTPGTRLLLEQLKGFPSCKYDDGPDALEMAVRLMREVFQMKLAGKDVESYSRERVVSGMLA